MIDKYEESLVGLLQKYAAAASMPVEKAISLPFGVYNNRDVYTYETDAIFRNEWVFICCEQELPYNGDYYAFDLVGEKLVILRGQNGKLQALSNNCRHRGTPLLNEGFGNTENNIVCPYHGWTYNDDGVLKAVPLPGAIEVEKKEHCLPKFRLESWHGLLFIHLGDNPVSLAQRFQGIDDYLGYFDLPSFQYNHQGSVEHWDANWKLIMENGIESYHLFKVHKNTLETVTPTRQAYYVAGSSEWTLTGGKMLDDSSKLMKYLWGKQPEVFNHYILISLPPSFVGILTHEGLMWLQVLPVNEHQSVIRSGGISSDKSSYESRASKLFTDAFFREDQEMCERVQQGMNSQCTSGGKLVELERVVADFHQFIASRLFDSPTSEFYQSSMSDVFVAKNEKSHG